jgi:integrase
MAAIVNITSRRSVRRSGHIRQRSPGSWEIRYKTAGRTATKTIRGTQADAQRALRQMMAEQDRGIAAAAPAKMLVADWLGQWLDLTAAEVRPITGERYEAAVRLYLAPALGHIKLRELSPAHIQAAFSTWATSGRHRGSGGLARSTLGLLRKTLHAALQRALELELLARHPMEPLRRRLPTGKAPEARVLDLNATAALLDQVTGTYRPAVLLAVACGLRRGEIVALKWRNVDLEAATLTVTEATVPLRRGTHTGKTKNGRTRTIIMPDFVVAGLRQLRLAMAERLLALGARLSGDHPVVAHEDGRPVNPQVLTAWCRRQFGKLHGLRHTHASQLLGAGVNIKAVSSRLGHSSAALTLSTYAHLLPGADQDAAQRIDDLLSGSKRVANKP